MSTSTQTEMKIKLERWKGRVPGGSFEFLQFVNLLEAVAPEVAIPASEIDKRIMTMIKHIHPPSIFLVAEVDDIVRGLIIAEVGNTENTRHVGWLRMEVHPDFRSHGLGDRLLNLMFETATEEGLRRLEITSYEPNIRARKFFLEHGFRTEGRHFMARRDPATGHYVDTYTLAKLLSMNGHLQAQLRDTRGH